MRLLVFGATGGTGHQVVEQAFEAGHVVTAVVRRPDGFDLRHQRLEVVKGDVWDPSTVGHVIHEKDVVISCLGVSH